mgnify:FL=1
MIIGDVYLYRNVIFIRFFSNIKDLFIANYHLKQINVYETFFWVFLWLRLWDLISSHDQATVLLAVRGVQPEYWNISENGYIKIDSEGQTEWKLKTGWRHKYIHPKKLEKMIGELMTALPKY